MQMISSLWRQRPAPNEVVPYVDEQVPPAPLRNMSAQPCQPPAPPSQSPPLMVSRCDSIDSFEVTGKGPVAWQDSGRSADRFAPQDTLKSDGIGSALRHENSGTSAFTVAKTETSRSRAWSRHTTVSSAVNSIRASLPRFRSQSSLVKEVSGKSMRVDFAIDDTQDLRDSFGRCFVGQAEDVLSTWALFVCHLSYSFYLSLKLAALVAAVNTAQSIMVLFPPASIRDATVLELVLPPLAQIVLMEPGLTGLSLMFRSMEEEEAIFARSTFRSMVLHVVAGYGCFIGVRLALRSTALSPEFTTLIEVLTLPTIISIGAHSNFILGGRRRGKPWRECLKAWLRCCIIFSYVVGLVGMLALNSFVLAKSPLQHYMGFILAFEKMCLRLLSNVSIQNGPCGFPEFLVSLGMHFELDTHMMNALGIAAASTPLVVIQLLVLDGLLFIMNAVKIYQGRTSLTLAEVHEMGWYHQQWKIASLSFQGYALLFPNHLYVANSIFIKMGNMAQMSACLWVWAVLWIMTLMRSEDGAPLKIEAYFLPFGAKGLEYLAYRIAFAFVQSLFYDALLLHKRLRVLEFLHVTTLGWKKTLYHVMMWSYSSWILVTMGFIGWSTDASA